MELHSTTLPYSSQSEQRCQVSVQPKVLLMGKIHSMQFAGCNENRQQKNFQLSQLFPPQIHLKKKIQIRIRLKFDYNFGLSLHTTTVQTDWHEKSFHLVGKQQHNWQMSRKMINFHHEIIIFCKKKLKKKSSVKFSKICTKV